MTRKRTYNRAFKLQALELVKTSKKSINEIERDLGITPGLLHKWKARMRADGEQVERGLTFHWFLAVLALYSFIWDCLLEIDFITHPFSPDSLFNVAIVRVLTAPCITGPPQWGA